MAKKGVMFARECRIFEVCNPHQAQRVLEANLEVSAALWLVDTVRRSHRLFPRLSRMLNKA